MTTSLDTIRYHSGIAGEEVANMVDSLEQEVSTLREQVEKLTKENERLARAWEAMQSAKTLATQNKKELFEQLAALAEQNEKMRTTLENTIIESHLDSTATIAVWRVKEALSLPNLTTPVLNKIKAEAYREAAEIAGPEDSYRDQWFKAKADSCAKLLAKADELEQSK